MSTLRALICFTIVTAIASADSITFRDGRIVAGSYLGGDSRSVRFATGDRVETFDLERISTINFVNHGAPPAPAAAPAPQPPPPPPANDQGALLASGTKITIRMIDSVDSRRDQMGKTFRASLDEPVTDGNGNTLIPRGADVVVKLVDDQESGKIAGRTILTLNLQSIMVNGRMVDINTMNVSEQSGSRAARSGKVIGGAAALGAIIGAAAGGGKGAAIGAGAGAGAGTVAEVATKGQTVHIPSETRLTFTLQDPIRL